MDELQFQKAEFGASRTACAACKSEIESACFRLGGKTICPDCADRVKALRQRPSTRRMLRGVLYGTGAAVLCSIGYAVFTMITDTQAAIIAIGVGFAVGKAVREGTRGLGGRRCQVLAVALTYCAILGGYVPPVIKAVREQAKAKTTGKGARTSEAAAGLPGTTSEPESGSPSDSSNEPVKSTTGKAVSAWRPGSPMARVLRWIVGVGLVAVGVLALLLVLPFGLLAGGFGGIITLVIIFVGLHQAWKMTRRDARPLDGPYEADGASNVA